MKNLTKEQSTRKAQIAQAMAEVESDLQNAIDQFNEQMTALYAPIEELQGRYNELIAEAQGFIETIHEQQEAYSEERSDSWHNGDSGQAYRDWMGEWNLDLEEIEIDTPDPLEEPPLEGADAMRELPDHP
jgi:uncharacterized protein YukE